MGISKRKEIWLLGQHVAKNGPLADPKRLGCPPRELQPHKRIMPTLMHEDRIKFGDQVSEHGKNRSRRAWMPNVQYRPLYSRALDMCVWVRVSMGALRAIEDAGGLDEYLVSVPRDLVRCDVALMYRWKLLEQYGVSRPEHPGLKVVPVERPPGIVGAARGRLAAERTEMLELLGKTYGPEYAAELEQAVTEQDLGIKWLRAQTA